MEKTLKIAIITKIILCILTGELSPTMLNGACSGINMHRIIINVIASQQPTLIHSPSLCVPLNSSALTPKKVCTTLLLYIVNCETRGKACVVAHTECQGLLVI